MSCIIDEVKGLYRVIRFEPLRKTPGVVFDNVPIDVIGEIGAIDRVLHDKSAVSPGPLKGVQTPWYMHEYQDDNLVVLGGKRFVDIYTKAHGKVEHFEITPTLVMKNGEIIAQGGAMLVWPRNVFHRVISGENGSASLNLAVHYEGFDIRTNFNIYELNIQTGRYCVIRAGSMDQGM